jgi:hypothetical protein
MTTVDTDLHDRLRPAPEAREQTAPTPATAIDLRAAIEAVTEYRRQTEMRRMAHLAARTAAQADWNVSLPRARLDAMERQLREATALRKMFDNGPLIVLCFAALPPHAVHDMPLSLARATGHADDANVRQRPLARLFVAADALRVQHALLAHDDAFRLTASLRRVDGRPLRCNVHVAAAYPDEPDWRWACIAPLAQHPAAQDADPDNARHLPPRSNQHPRAWPMSSRG